MKGDLVEALRSKVEALDRSRIAEEAAAKAAEQNRMLVAKLREASMINKKLKRDIEESKSHSFVSHSQGKVSSMLASLDSQRADVASEKAKLSVKGSEVVAHEEMLLQKEAQLLQITEELESLKGALETKETALAESLSLLEVKSYDLVRRLLLHGADLYRRAT